MLGLLTPKEGRIKLFGTDINVLKTGIKLGIFRKETMLK